MAGGANLCLCLCLCLQTLDASGAPLLAYVDANVGGAATVSTFQAGAWRPVGGFAGVSAGATTYTSLALAADGTPWLAYSDSLNNKRAVVKRLGQGPSRWEECWCSG